MPACRARLSLCSGGSRRRKTFMAGLVGRRWGADSAHGSALAHACSGGWNYDYNFRDYQLARALMVQLNLSLIRHLYLARA